MRSRGYGGDTEIWRGGERRGEEGVTNLALLLERPVERLCRPCGGPTCKLSRRCLEHAW